MARLLSHAGQVNRWRARAHSASCAASAGTTAIITLPTPRRNDSLRLTRHGLIIRAVTRRRLHVSNLRPGTIELTKSDAHHARDVLRLTVGTPVELFDDIGNRADATI